MFYPLTECTILLSNMIPLNLIMENTVLLRKRYLQEHHKGYYTVLLLQEKLTEHLNRVDDIANAV